MAITPKRLSTVPFNQPGQNPVEPPLYVSARVLAANTAESITIPTGAIFVRVAANADFYYSFSGAAAVPVDTDDGSACEMIKVSADAVWFKIPSGATALSVISAAISIVTASFFGN